MSAIGTGSLGAMSFAGTQAAAKSVQKEGGDAKESASAKKMQIDQSDHIEKANGVADTDLSQERDADGRLTYHVQQQDETDNETNDAVETEAISQVKSQPDAFGETGTILNLDA